MTLRMAALAALVVLGSAILGSAGTAVAQSASIAAPDCEKPDPRPLENRPGNDSSEIMAYNAKVHRYNRMSQAFSACSKAYVEGVSREIDRLRESTKEQNQRIVTQANARIHRIAAEVEAAVAVGNGGTAPVIADPEPDFPPATCERPAENSPDYAARRREFEACTRDYIARGKAAMDQTKEAADKGQQQVTADATRRVALLNTLAQQAADGANDDARRTAAVLNGTAP